jgi:phage gp46-like protein
MPKDLALTNFNVHTARYNFARGADGDVAFDESQAFPVMSSAICRKNGYWADRDHGSELFKLRNLTSATPSEAEAMVLDAELPLEKAQLVTNVRVDATSARTVSGNQLAVDVFWDTPGGPGGRRRLGV